MTQYNQTANIVPEADAFEVTDATDPGTTIRRRKTRDRLIEAAYEVFSESGVPGAAVETICERAGFTRGAFYSNFSTKEELFFALMERENNARVSRLEGSVAAVLPELHNSAEALTEEFIVRLLDNFFGAQAVDRRWCLVQEEFALLAMRSSEVAAEYRAFSHDFFEKLAAVVTSALTSVGLRFRGEAVDVVKLLAGVYERALRESLLEGSLDSTAGGPGVGGQGFDNTVTLVPAVVLALTERIPRAGV
ncbi:hypothetical protein GCM10022198_23790 [Klugiella xanthotipulae]|uniref:TetR family transcriptional regulator n=1 Tax=Klugiella xanthotipulae TaxID=244735 RepID=A0A543I6G5_9MICO|nr:TetR/AcrR family transcriptional regulator [Klugiella xanthotipulae]TQM66174.1 TetR family transcriptional regulator [Klugiella xanthotipulae]